MDSVKKFLEVDFTITLGAITIERTSRRTLMNLAVQTNGSRGFPCLLSGILILLLVWRCDFFPHLTFIVLIMLQMYFTREWSDSLAATLRNLLVCCN